MSQLEVNKVIPQSGTTLTLGESGDTVSVPSGATLDASNATLTLPDDSVTTAKIDDGAVTSAKITYPLTTFSSTGIDDDGTSTAITINSSNNVALAGNIGLGGATPTTSGTGITFPATASASTNANTLDDYEEGTWTPSHGGNTTYIDRFGTYRKVGSLVFVNFGFTINNLGTGSASNIEGFPFTSTGTGQTLSVSYYATLALSKIYVIMRIDSSSTTAVSGSTNGTSTSLENVPGIFGDSTVFYGSGCYIAS